MTPIQITDTPTRPRFAGPLLSILLSALMLTGSLAHAGPTTLEQAPLVAPGTPTNPPPLIGTDLGVNTQPIPDPVDGLLAAITQDLIDGGFPQVGSQLGAAGLTRAVWDDHINIEVRVPTTYNSWGWEFDLLMFLEFTQTGTGLGCTFALPILNPSDDVPVSPAEVSFTPVVQCWEMTAEAIAFGLPGTHLLFDNATFMDVLWPIGYSLFGGSGPTINGNGDRIYDCAALRWDSDGGLLAAIGGAGTAGLAMAQAVLAGGLAGSIATWASVGLGGMVLGEVSLGTAGAIVTLAGFVSGAAVAALVVGAAVGGAMAARGIWASANQGSCPGCAGFALAGEDCRVVSDECICREEARWGAPPQCAAASAEGKDEEIEVHRDPNDVFSEVPPNFEDEGGHESGGGFGAGSTSGGVACRPGGAVDCADACNWDDESGAAAMDSAQTSRSCNFCDDGTVDCFEVSTVPMAF